MFSKLPQRLFSDQWITSLAKRVYAIISVSVLAAACATGPKFVRSSSNYAIESVTVVAAAGPLSFASSIESGLKQRLLVSGVGNKARLSVRITQLRYKGSSEFFLVRNYHSTSAEVILKSSASGLTLRNFTLGARSYTNSREAARSEMSQSITNQLTRILPQIVRPVTQKKKPLKCIPAKKVSTKKVVAKKVAKPAFPERETPAAIQVNVQPKPIVKQAKPELLPVAIAYPNNEPAPVPQVDVTPTVPKPSIAELSPAPVNDPFKDAAPTPVAEATV